MKGKKKWLVNQDRNEIIELKSIKQLYTAPAKFKGKIIGFNLFSENILLGTFDELAEILKELNAIINSNEEFYVVSGFNL